MNESALYRLKNLIDHNVISVHKNQFKIGRATTNDLAIENNRFISSSHCIFEFDNGHVYIRDTSSNGTLINRSKKIQKNDSPIELQSGDIIHLVFRKDEPGANIIYQLDLSPITKSTQPTEQKLKRKFSESKENADLSNTSIDVEMKRLKANEDLAMKAGDDMENILTCVCCQDIMTNPICLEPCLHAFCNDCYGSWEAVQRTCPKCRAKVIGKKKNVVINGILEAFLKAYPQKRPVLKTIDNTNCPIKTTTDTKIEVNQTIMDDDDDDDEEEEEDDEMDDDDNDEDDDDNDEEEDNDNDEEEDEDEEEDDNDDHFVLMVTTPVPDVRFVCRQCPPIGSSVLANRANTNVLSTNFQCRPGQKHILCQCCFQPMPDRQDEPNIHQSCGICHQYFCNIYFQQCQRQGCSGCLNQLQSSNLLNPTIGFNQKKMFFRIVDFNFDPRHLVNFVNDNPVETQIVQNYLKAHRLTMRELLVHCCQRLDRKEFSCSNIDRNLAVPSTKVVCYKCGLNIFKELAYQFRVAMKLNEILPIAMRNRENCYYGKKCRTQYTKQGHAQKLNHACEQTRF